MQPSARPDVNAAQLSDYQITRVKQIIFTLVNLLKIALPDRDPKYSQ